VKGKKFHATTAQAAIWFDGKTMWTYMKNSDEVNISHPSSKQLQAMNPYNFINIYKKGYKMEMTKGKGIYTIHLTADNSQQHIEEMYLSVSSSNYHLKEVKMAYGHGQGKKNWNTYTITSIRQKALADACFAFQQKDFPTAEVIDLR
jgi:outer membrane lipoprotein-sorting protein